MASLSERQAQILALAVEGLTDEAIAEELGVTTHTVKSHLRRTYARMGLAHNPDINVRVVAVRAWWEDTGAYLP